jgi:hypothetical protein
MKVHDRVARLSKWQCEQIIARHDEDTDWVEPYEHLATIYSQLQSPPESP